MTKATTNAVNNAVNKICKHVGVKLLTARLLTARLLTVILLTVILLMMTVFASAQPVREFVGTFRYFADAAVFESCEGASWPVAMQGGYLALERLYLQQASGGEAVFVRVQGRLVVLPNMEDRPTEFLEVTQVLEFDPTRSADGCTVQVPRYQPVLHEGHWQLTELTGFDKNLADFERVPYLRFSHEEGVWRVSAYAGCNQLSAPYVTQAERLLIGSVVMTQRACVGEQGALEAAFVRVLMRADGHNIVGENLILVEDGQPLARFRFNPKTPSP